ncbi:hypothetical protein DH2020_025365 [Rehmannia glutinosa]|uniref:Malic enzyme n=1 Tax=Rehmannia glutinosa TaxID=99300 RepID=A0ABR0VZY2_REHGL
MDSTFKELNGDSVLDLEDKAGVGGGVQDVYGEDRASENQPITPWTVSVASGYTMLRDPRHNKGLAFTDKERDAHYLTGLLPPVVLSQELQEKRLMHNLRQYKVPLHRYMAMMDLQERNENCSTSCLWITSRNYFQGKILEVLRNWPEKSIQVIVVTDGERILGLGDLGCQCLPITIDVGTNNKKLLEDEFYIGLRQNRATGQEYAELLEEFMSAVKQNYGEKVLIQFEDFANHNAFDLLAKYRTTHLVFNDDIQGTASVVLAGIVSALKFVGGSLSDHTFLFLGAGEGLIVSSRKESLQHFKTPWAHEHEPVKELLDAVKAIKPTVLIGTSGVGRTFTKEVVETMASINEKPVILALSNPTSQSECTAEEAYMWSEGRAIFASGSPFDPVEYNGQIFVPGQANNAYIFPGFGLGLIMSGTIRVHDDLLLAASQVSEENYAKGLIYPPFTNIRKISAHIAAKVAARSYELGLASRLPRPKDLVGFAESCMYSPVYPKYR